MNRKQTYYHGFWRATLVLALFLLNSAYMFAQSVVTGVVKDNNGEELIGVSVVEKGSKANGTVTGIDGKYSIKVAQGKTLVFSYIGYTTKEITVKGTNINVTLEDDSKMLNDVVVIGYGSMARKDVTSSITTIKADNLNKGTFTDAASMLQGKVAGLVVTTTGDPNGGSSITLRGASTLRTGAMSPYYVIDGIPGVDVSMVAPDDIESIDVLRDATATAIYGSKAANGVIIITTKKGKSYQDKVNVTYSGYVAFDNVLKTFDLASADDLRALSAKTGTEIDDDGVSTDWKDEVLRTAVSHNHNLSINGGNKKTTYMASVNYVDREGVIKGSKMNRFNVRALVSTKILKDHLDISAGVNTMYAKHVGVPMGNEGASVLDAMNSYSPTRKVKNDDGTWTEGSGSKNYNPLSLIYEDTSETIWKRDQFIGKATLNIIDGLSWNANYSYNNYQSTYSAYDTRNSQIAFPASLASKNGQATRNTYFGNESTFETYGNFNKVFAEKHKLDLMLGYSWEEKVNGDGFGLTVHDFYTDELKWNNLTYASTIDNIDAVQAGVKETIRNISFYGRASYSFDSRYMLQATIRRDGSSVFGKDNRWGTFPSISAAWNITEEKFMKDIKAIETLKLRMGYGISGNAMGFGANTAVATYGVTGNWEYDGKSWRTLNATKNANPDLKWEKTGMFNVGVDFGFFGGRLTGSIEYYNKVTNDLIWNYPVSTNVYQFGNIDANVGKITNKGVELSITAIPIDKKNFKWTTTLNLSHNKNVVNRVSSSDGKFNAGRFSQGDPMVAGVSSNGYTQRVVEGEALGTFYTFKFAGYNADGNALYYTYDDQGNVTGKDVIANLDDVRDRQKTGCAQPKLNLGWNNTINYKDLSITMFFTGVFGNDIYSGSRAHYNSPSQFANSKNVLKEYITDRPATDTDPNIPSDRWIENGSYLRLKTLTVGYTFRHFNDWIQSLNIYATCNNVFTITKYKGLDPEVNLGGIDPGIEYRWSRYPHTRTVMLGAKINF
ncbi:MAG: TonB-dependent receptor [Bacteroidaceae bacterium]|nr:TonB-dependent receptor [Bacteroidaceae bacterium]